jgi:NAD(P)-dependent dehydrogenase (short-subunit alcohol dehydrogenase family)
MSTKNVVVTGSSRGIGQAVALEFAKAGYSLVINSRNADELSASKEEILKAIHDSAEIVTFTGDISQEHVCKGLMDVAEKKLGGLDVLVNNAGINGPEKDIVDISSTEWDKVLDINLKGSFFCSREAIKKMLSQIKRPDSPDYSIINISSR